MPEQKPENSPSEKESAHERIERLKDEAVRRIGSEILMQRIYDFATELKDRHPNYTHYKYYHWLIGSTPLEDATKEDFPEPDSVETFLRSLIEG